MACPWWRELLYGLLASSIVGFQTTDDCMNFLDSVDALPRCRVDRTQNVVTHDGRRTAVRAYPVSLEWPNRLVSESLPVDACREAVRRELGLEPGIRLGIGVDRLDYTKGIVQRLTAYETFLLEHPEWHGRVCFVQIQVPSRESVPEYRALREEIDRIVGRITGRLSTAEWTPLRYLCHGFSRRELAVFYRAADALLVTPLRDGMNLVAQEFVATRADEDGVLILSRFAGAAERLREALIVNPYDVNGLCHAIERAMAMEPAERRVGMRAMRKRVMSEDMEWWLGWFLAAASTVDGGRARKKRARSARSSTRRARTARR
jgi:trehalose 6-phosphate synthase